MHSFIIIFGVFILAVAVIAYMVTDRFGQSYDEHLIQNRPFEQPSIVLATFGAMVLIVGLFLKEEDETK